MTEKVLIGNAELWHGDCRDVLPTLGKFDAVITDPPYGKVKGDFDQNWTTREGMLPDVDLWLDAVVPRMKANATLWWFAWPSLAGRIEAKIADRLNVLAHVVWQKPAPTSQKCRKESLRAPIPATERILMAEHYGADNMALGESGYISKCDDLRGFIFEPLRSYLAEEWRRAGLTARDANEATKTQMAGHWFTTTQWALPTERHYKILRDRANASSLGEFLRRDYESLRRDYEFLRRDYESLRRDYESLRRYFDCQSGDQFSDVWLFPPPRQNHGHPTEKPVQLMAYIVRLSVPAGGVVVDPFMGSGTTGVACAQLGRSFVGIERDQKYFDIACERILRTYSQGSLLSPEQPAQRVQGGLL
jgi:adenine-specific DNA-methyltransferase